MIPDEMIQQVKPIKTDMEQTDKSTSFRRASPGEKIRPDIEHLGITLGRHC